MGQPGQKEFYQMNSSIEPKQRDFNTRNTSAASPWRSWLHVHPAAKEFPRLADTDARALALDIKRNGLREPVSVIKEGKGYVLLDGISRLDAMEQAGKKIDINDRGTFEHLSSTVDVHAFVISKNIHRRHLNSEDKRKLVGKLLEANPEQSDRQVAGTVKVSPTTVGAVRAKMEAAGDVSKLDTRRDTKGRQQPSKKVAHTAPKRHQPPASPVSQPLRLHTRTLIDRWDHAAPEERLEFVKERWADISRVREKLEAVGTQLWEQADAGLDIPPRLRREP
jgi:hypothetical protein